MDLVNFQAPTRHDQFTLPEKSYFIKQLRPINMHFLISSNER